SNALGSRRGERTRRWAAPVRGAGTGRTDRRDRERPGGVRAPHRGKGGGPLGGPERAPREARDAPVGYGRTRRLAAAGRCGDRARRSARGADDRELGLRGRRTERRDRRTAAGTVRANRGTRELPGEEEGHARAPRGARQGRDSRRRARRTGGRVQAG